MGTLHWLVRMRRKPTNVYLVIRDLRINVNDISRSSSPEVTSASFPSLGKASSLAREFGGMAMRSSRTLLNINQLSLGAWLRKLRTMEYA